MRGQELVKACEAWMECLDLTTHQWKLAGNLSGGNKRKLCVALAMIGDPEVILLDEPSAGMDPEARRFMWNVIHEIARTRKQASVVLTTHSMEECEALCSRLGIMVSGVFGCMGTHAEIKKAYGSGRQLQLKLRPPTEDEALACAAQLGLATLEKTRGELVALLQERSDWLAMAARGDLAPFPPHKDKESSASTAVIAEWVFNAMNVQKAAAWIRKLDEAASWISWTGTTVRFTLSEHGTLADLFAQVHAQTEELSIVEYSLAPTTLEQIFHNFANRDSETDQHASVKMHELDDLFTWVDTPRSRHTFERTVDI